MSLFWCPEFNINNVYDGLVLSLTYGVFTRSSKRLACIQNSRANAGRLLDRVNTLLLKYNFVRMLRRILCIGLHSECTASSCCCLCTNIWTLVDSLKVLESPGKILEWSMMAIFS